MPWHRDATNRAAVAGPFPGAERSIPSSSSLGPRLVATGLDGIRRARPLRGRSESGTEGPASWLCAGRGGGLRERKGLGMAAESTV